MGYGRDDEEWFSPEQDREPVKATTRKEPRSAVRRLKARIADLEAKLAAKTDAYDRLEVAIDERERECERLRFQLAASEAKCAELSNSTRKAFEEHHERTKECIDLRDKLAAALARAEEAERVKGALIALLKRTYKAAMKPDWEEGECLNEVLGDVHWEMERPDREAAMERDLRQAMGERGDE